jgi:polar amino acid transport system ATP-binding protein
LISFETGDVQIGKHKFNAKITYPQALYGQVGVVFQHHNLFPHLSALDNVSLALRKVKQITKAEAKLRALSELEHLGLSDQATQYPASLSGGERQRVAIARALAMDPLLLLLDEPTSGLDPQLINEVFRAIDSLASCGTTMLLITHNINFAKQTGSQFAILQDGKLKQSQDSNIFDQLNDFNSSK